MKTEKESKLNFYEKLSKLQNWQNKQIMANYRKYYRLQIYLRAFAINI